MIIYELAIDDDIKKIFVNTTSIALLTKKWEAGLNPRDSDPFDCKGKRKVNDWHPQDLKWFRDDGKNIDRYKDPDVSYYGISARLIFSPHACELVKTAIEDVAELLPVLANDEIWYFLNVFNVAEAIDEANSKYNKRANGERGIIIKLALLPKKVPHAQLFMLPRDPSIYYAEHQPDDNPNTFKNILEQNKLTGLSLRQIREY